MEEVCPTADNTEFVAQFVRPNALHFTNSETVIGNCKPAPKTLNRKEVKMNKKILIIITILAIGSVLFYGCTQRPNDTTTTVASLFERITDYTAMGESIDLISKLEGNPRR